MYKVLCEFDVVLQTRPISFSSPKGEIEVLKGFDVISKEDFDNVVLIVQGKGLLQGCQVISGSVNLVTTNQEHIEFWERFLPNSSSVNLWALFPKLNSIRENVKLVSRAKRENKKWAK
jgi:hypothetical protein